MAYDCIVIGSGMSGLTTATVLARRGMGVALVERATHTAPLLRRRIKEGLPCDLGMHYFGGLSAGGGFGALLRYLGVYEALAPEKMDTDYDVLALPDGRRLGLPSGGFEAVRERLFEAFPNSAGAVRAYMERIAYLYERTPFANVEVSPEAFSPGPRWEEPADKLLRAAGAGDDLAQALGTYGLILSGTPGAQAPMHLHAMVLGSYMQGAHTFRDGGDGLADAMERAAREAGVEILTGHRVESILARRRQVHGVETTCQGQGGRRLEADRCVWTAHPKRLLGVVSSDTVRPTYARRLWQLAETFAPFVLHVSAPAQLAAQRRSNLYLMPDGREWSRGDVVGIMAPGAPGAADRVGISILRLAWDNAQEGAVCFGASLGRCRNGHETPRGARAGNYRDWEAEMTATTLERAYEAWPALRGKCRALEVMGPCEFERVSNGWWGSMYGVRHLPGGSGVSPMGPLQGLYLAGQSVVTPGVAGAMISGMLVSGMIAGWGDWWREVRDWL